MRAGTWRRMAGGCCGVFVTLGVGVAAATEPLPVPAEVMPGSACPPVVGVASTSCETCYTPQGVSTFLQLFQAAAAKGVENATIRAFNQGQVVPTPCDPPPPAPPGEHPTGDRPKSAEGGGGKFPEPSRAARSAEADRQRAEAERAEADARADEERRQQEARRRDEATIARWKAEAEALKQEMARHEEAARKAVEEARKAMEKARSSMKPPSHREDDERKEKDRNGDDEKPEADRPDAKKPPGKMSDRK